MKKLISVLLSVLMIFSALSVCFTASAYSDYSTGISDLPCIYIQGQGSNIITEDGEVVYGSGDPGDSFDLMGAVQECLPYLKDALLTNDWTPYQQKLLEIADAIYGKVRLDGNGDPQYGTHLRDTSWLPDQYQNRVASGGKYALRAYNFYIDWRLDPFETAAVLHEYIQNVKIATGKDKVNITARCEGNNIVGAYLAEYGSDDINCLNIYISTLYGCEPISSLFSGRINLDLDALKRFKDQDFPLDDPLIDALINNTADLLVDTYASLGLSIAAKPLLMKLYKEAVVPVIRASYGTMPGIWAIVGSGDYELAKYNIFKGVEDEYAGLIAKLDDYDKRVRRNIDNVILEAVENGTKVAVWSKYGDYTMYPICQDNALISDGVVTITESSFGATQTHIGEVLSNDYIKKAEAAGTAKYISPDKVCDVSTALLPDTTWVIYKSEHRDFPECIHEVMAEFFISDGEMNVFSNENIPQFLYCSDGEEWQQTVSPLTAENGMQPKTEQAHTKESIKDKAIAFVKALFALLKNLFEQKISEISKKG